MLCVEFIDLENEYNRILKEILDVGIMKKRLPEVYVNVIMDMCEKASTKVKRLSKKLRNLMSK